MHEIYTELSRFLGNTTLECRERFKSIDINKLWEKRESLEKFYGNTDFYLYDLTHYANDTDRIAFGEELKRFIKKKNLKTGLDYGCGIGTDILSMFEGGIEYAYGIDIYSKCTEYMEWRIEDRHIKKPFQFMPVVENQIYPECDIVICIAVLEHIENPMEVLKGLVGCCKYMVLRVDPTNPNGAHPMHIEKNFPILSDVDSGKPQLLNELGIKRIDDIATMPLFEICR